jgi:hypothetical protein
LSIVAARLLLLLMVLLVLLLAAIADLGTSKQPGVRTARE